MSNISLGEVAAAQDRRATIEPDPRLTPAVPVGAAFAIMLVLAAVFTQLHSQISVTVAATVMAGVVAGVGWSTRMVGALVAAGLGWLFLNGFAVDRAGSLHWHGAADLSRLAVLLCCAVVGASARARIVAQQRSRSLAVAGFDTCDDIWAQIPTPIEGLVPYQRTFSPRGEQHA